MPYDDELIRNRDRDKFHEDQRSADSHNVCRSSDDLVLEGRFSSCSIHCR